MTHNRSISAPVTHNKGLSIKDITRQTSVLGDETINISKLIPKDLVLSKREGYFNDNNLKFSTSNKNYDCTLNIRLGVQINLDKLISYENIEDLCELLKAPPNQEIEFDQEVIKIIMYLFYYNDGVKLPKIYDYINNPDNLNKLKIIAKLCELLDNRLSLYKIDKKNHFYSDQHNFNEILHSSIANAKSVCIFLDNTINIQESETDISHNTKNLKTVITNMIVFIDRLIEGGANFSYIKSDISIKTDNDFHPKYDISGQILENCLANFILNSGSGVRQLDNGKLEETFGIEALGDALIGVIWALNKSKPKVAIDQAIGIYKKILLQLVDRLYNHYNNVLSLPVFEKLEKIMGIKRGGFLDKYTSWGTSSAKKFKEVTKNSFNNISKERSFIDIKYQLENFLEKSDYGGLDDYIKKLEDKEKNILCSIVIKHKGFIGNLLEHIYYALENQDIVVQNLSQPHLSRRIAQTPFIVGKYNSILSQLKKIDELRLQNLKIGTLEKTFIDMGVNDFYRYLTNYNIKNKHDVLCDFSSLKLGLELNTNLTNKEKKDIIAYINRQLNEKDSGIFAQVRSIVDMSVFARIIVGALSYQGGSAVSPLSALIAKNYGVSRGISNVLKIVSSGLGYGAMNIPGVMNNHKTGDTLEYKSLRDMFANFGLKYNKSDINVVENQTTQLTFTEFEDNIKKHIKAKDFSAINATLANISSKETIYYYLTHISKDSFLLDQVMQSLISEKSRLQQIYDDIDKSDIYPNFVSTPSEIEKKREKSIYSKKILKINQAIKDFANHWQESIKAYYGDNYLTSKDSIKNFKNYVANINIKSSTDAKLKFYELLNIIDNSDTSTKEIKLKYLIGIFTRAYDDPTSKWHDLSRFSSSNEYFFRTYPQIFTSVLIGGVAISAVFTASLSLPVVAGVFGVLYFLRSGINLAAQYSTHSKYVESNTMALSLETYSLSPNLSEDNKNKIQKQIKDYDSSMSPPLFYNIYTAGRKNNYIINKELIINNESLSAYLNNDEMRVNYKTDDEYIELLNNIKKSDNDREKVTVLLKDIIEPIQQEIADKYLANEAFFRVIRIIKLSELNNYHKVKLLVFFNQLFEARSLEMSEYISTDRYFSTKNNYFLPHLLSIALATSANTVYALPNLLPVYQSLIGSSFDIVSGLGFSIAPTTHTQKNTKSFQVGTSILKYVLLDELNQMETNNNYNGIDYKNAKQIINNVLKKHTGRFPWTRLGETTSAKQLKDMILP